MAVGTRLSLQLADFGTRSLVTHSLMVLGFIGAVYTGLFVEGQVGTVSMAAFINFTAGLWISQSIHSLGNTAREDEYDGVIAELKRYVE